MTSNASRVAYEIVFGANFTRKLADHPSRLWTILLEPFGRKNARAADRTNERFRRELNATLHDEGEKEAISSLSGIPETSPPNNFQENSPDLSKNGAKRSSDKESEEMDVESQHQSQVQERVKPVGSSTKLQSVNDTKASSSPSQSKNESDAVKTAGTKHLSDKESGKKDGESQPQSRGEDNDKTAVSSTKLHRGNDIEKTASPSQSKNESDAVKTAGTKHLSDKESGKKDGESQLQSQGEDNVEGDALSTELQSGNEIKPIASPSQAKSGSKAVKTTGTKRLSNEESKISDGESTRQSQDEDNVKVLFY